MRIHASLVALLVCGLVSSPAQAQAITSVEIRVDATKSNGKAWDMFDGDPDVFICFDEGQGEWCSLINDTADAALRTPNCQDLPAGNPCLVTGFSLTGPTVRVRVLDQDLAEDDPIGYGECAVAAGECRVGSSTVVLR